MNWEMICAIGERVGTASSLMNRRHAAIVALLAVLCGSDARAQTVDRAGLRSELTEALEVYVTAFSDGRLDFIVDSVYMAPAYFFGGDEVEVRMTRADVRERFEEMLAPLPAQGYARSEIRGSDVCILSESAALVTLHFARVRTDGSVMLEGTAIYFYARTPEGWRISASIGSSRRMDCHG